MCAGVRRAGVAGAATLVALWLAGCGPSEPAKTPDPNQPGMDGRRPLQVAIDNNDLARAQALLAAGASVAGETPPDGVMIHRAAARGNAAMVQLLLEHNADVQARTRGSNTALHMASTREVAELLVSRGLDVNARNLFRETPLHTASAGGLAPVVDVLLAHGADPKAVARDGDTTPLNVASNRAVAALLFAAGAPVNGVPNERGRCLVPLYSAAGQGYADVVAFLLEHGASPDSRRDGGPYDQTVLSLAVQRGRDVVVEELLAAGAHPSLPGNERLFTEAVTFFRTNIVKSLLAHGVKPADSGADALAAAAGNGDVEMLNLLLAAGVPVSGARRNAGEPLICAARGRPPIHRFSYQLPGTARSPANYVACAKLLLERGADPNADDGHGFTPLHAAAAGNCRATAELLLERGAVVDAKDNYHATPLHWAVINDAVDVATLLVGKGADVNAGLRADVVIKTTKQGDLPNPFGGRPAGGPTPLANASSEGMRKLLLDHGATAAATPLATPAPPAGGTTHARTTTTPPSGTTARSGTTPAAAASPAASTAPAFAIGATEAEVIAARGQPRARLAAGKRIILQYAGHEVVLQDGKVICP